jgi:hypothetical protein
MINRLHREHLERQAVIHGKVHEIHQHLMTKPVPAHDMPGPGTPAPAAREPPDRAELLGNLSDQSRHDGVKWACQLNGSVSLSVVTACQVTARLVSCDMVSCV